MRFRTCGSALCLIASAACVGSTSRLPPGWRLPTAAELSGPERAESPSRYGRAVADFNNDGWPDEAVLVQSTRFGGEGLLVRLSCGRSCDRWVKLDEFNFAPRPTPGPLAMGVVVVPPGDHEYICDDTDGPCDGSWPRPVMHLDVPAIEYFKFESASSLFYWHEGRFRRLWTSD